MAQFNNDGGDDIDGNRINDADDGKGTQSTQGDASTTAQVKEK